MRPEGGDGAHECDRLRPFDGVFLPPARAESEIGIGQIRHLLDEAPENLPRRNREAVIPAVVPADVHKPDKTALPARNRKCACNIQGVQPTP
jgi:hypothetical protein